jgi:uncharacterized protein
MLAGLDVVQRPGEFVYMSIPDREQAPADAIAMVDEGTTVTYVVPARSSSAVDGSFAAAWLTLTVHCSLEAIGLTAAVAGALSARSIPANVLAGQRHDHVLVPVAHSDQAIAAVRALRTSPGTTTPTGNARTPEPNDDIGAAETAP